MKTKMKIKVFMQYIIIVQHGEKNLGANQCVKEKTSTDLPDFSDVDWFNEVSSTG